MSKNFFFESKGPFKLNILFPEKSKSKIIIKDIKTLDKAGKSDLTFFDSINYKDSAKKTKASCCITKENLKDYILHLDNWIPKNILNNLLKNYFTNFRWYFLFFIHRVFL